MINSIRVAIIDPQPIFREGVKQVISGAPGQLLVAEASRLSEAGSLILQARPDILLLEIDSPGISLDGVASLINQFNAMKIIILTARECEQSLLSTFQCGVRGYVVKGVSGRQLTEIIQSVHLGGSYAEPHLASAVLASNPREQKQAPTPAELLTARENEILDCVAKAMTNKEIALAYNLTEKTVKHYMTSILQKLNVRNRVEAALLAEKYRRKQVSSVNAPHQRMLSLPLRQQASKGQYEVSELGRTKAL